MDDINLIETELQKNYVYNGRILNLRADKVTLPNGKTSEREYVEHRGGAAVLAVDNEENVYLVRQFRYPYREILTEIPAGKLEVGETPEKTAIRELAEETGLSGDVSFYGIIYPTPAYTNEKIYIYLAENLTCSKTHFDEDEFLDVIKMPIKTVLKQIYDGTIKDGKTCYAVLKYAAQHGIR